MKRIGIFVLLSIFIGGCQSAEEVNLEKYVSDGNSEVQDIDNDYTLALLYINKESDKKIDSVLQHFQQSLVANVEVDRASISELPKQLDSYDLIYLGDELAEDEDFNALQKQLKDFVSSGGTLFLSHDYGPLFSSELTGIDQFVDVDTKEISFTYHDVGENVTGLQSIWKSFAETYNEYDGLDKDEHIHFEYAADVDEATSLVEIDGLSYLTVNELGEGSVIWSNQFMPNEQFITSFNLEAENEEQEYFHFGYATANYLFRTELLNTVSKEKYGFTLKKAYGPYGRPGLAWQNHYEETYSYALNDLINWSKWLKEEGQIPTFSLVRGTYNSGQWHTTLSYHENIGEGSTPAFIGNREESHFAAGEILTTADEYIQFDRYPGYHTLQTPIEDPYRAYPAIINLGDNKGETNLIVGGADGMIYLLKDEGVEAEIRYPNVEEVFQLPLDEKYAAPFAVDLMDNGRDDLVVGSDTGAITYYENESEDDSLSFADPTPLTSNGEPIVVGKVSAPMVVDWTGNGHLDLLIGSEDGSVMLFEGNGTLDFNEVGKIQADGKALQVGRFSAPFATDWGNKDRLELLVGSDDGKIHQFAKTSVDEVTEKGPIEGNTLNFFGGKSLHMGKNTVPLVADFNHDGSMHLLTGHLEYGIPTSLESEYNPYLEDTKKSVQYALDNHIPLIPHMFLHGFMDNDAEKQEIELHKQTFHELGIEWDEDMGVNHHTWRINNDAARTFNNQADQGIWWNFGFNPPHVKSAPRDGIEFLLVAPFMLAADEESDSSNDWEDFVLHSPVANAYNFPKAWDALAAFDIPLTYFEHIEHGLEEGTDIYEQHKGTIAFMNEFREANDYTFMTEQQMARSLLATFYGEVAVQIEDDQLIIEPDMSKVPDNIKEYENTLGIRLELGEDYKDKQVATSSLFYNEVKDRHYIGLDEKQAVYFDQDKDMTEQIHVLRSNGPLDIKTESSKMEVDLKTKGMQEFELYSPIELEITGNEDVEVTKEGSTYMVRHYGDETTVEIKAVK